MNKLKHWPWVVTAFLTLLLWLQTCNVSHLKKDKENQANQITQLDLDRQKLKTIMNSQEETILTQRVIETHSQKAINDLTDSIFKLKDKDQRNTNTIAYLKVHQRVRIDSFPVPYEKTGSIADRLHFSDSVIRACQDVIDAMDEISMIVPVTAHASNQYFNLQATINKDHLQIDSLIVFDEMNVRFVEKKGKLFKPKTVEVQFFHTNPLFDTQKANSVIYKPKKQSFFKRVLLPIAVGLGAGLLISK